MVYDPAWDMPKINWRQQGSFEVGEVPPITEPDAEPLVCLPPINQYWLPYVMGALDQLRNPSSWLVADDTAMYDTLARVTKLREMLGVRVPCMSFAIRFDAASCQLQQSVDGGSTWTEVDGWSDFVTCLPPQTLVEFDSGCTLSQSLDGGMTYDAIPGWLENFGDCVQKYTPIIGLPPNPGDEAPDQFACSIAAYLASEVVLNAMSAGVTAIQDDLTLLAFGATVLDLIPEFILVRLGYDAVAVIYTAIAEGTLSDYQDAIDNADLWHDITCAIYGAIVADGYVTPVNFSAIVAAVAAVPYAHADVISAIVDYLNSLGATGLAQLSQRAGLLVGSDCSACDAWCRYYDFTSSAYAFSSAFTGGSGAYIPGVGWDGQAAGAFQVLDIENGFTGTFTVDSCRLVGASTIDVGFGTPQFCDAAVANIISFPGFPAGAWDVTEDGPITISSMRIRMYGQPSGTTTILLTGMYLTGRGTPPIFGVPC